MVVGLVEVVGVWGWGVAATTPNAFGGAETSSASCLMDLYESSIPPCGSLSTVGLVETAEEGAVFTAAASTAAATKAAAAKAGTASD